MQDIKKRLKIYYESGVTEFYQERPRNLIKEKKEANIVSNTKKSTMEKANLITELKPISQSLEEARNLAEKANNLSELKEILLEFKGCELYKTAQNLVFADGDINSDVILIGEAPGASEDEQGIPFCGISGKLLDDIFRSIGRTRAQNLYITNSVFWRPPGNRRPTDEEIAICRPFVERHIFLKKPKLIILVGGTALASILPDVSDTISKIRGKIMEYQNPYLENKIAITAIFHPSYLLRQPLKKKIMWHDMVMINNHLINN
jgi:uracil-DNA glycosylase family 4